LLAIVLSACAGPHEPAPREASSSPAPSTSGSAVADASSAPRPTAGSSEAGTWSSPGCGERTYERVITLTKGSFEAQDRVSPCPPGVACVWSGVVPRAGTYRIDGTIVSLALDDASKQAKGPPVVFPATLELEGDHLVELTASGARCVYVRRP
jgi:hypothetical protein